MARQFREVNEIRRPDEQNAQEWDEIRNRKDDIHVDRDELNPRAQKSIFDERYDKPYGLEGKDEEAFINMLKEQEKAVKDASYEARIDCLNIELAKHGYQFVSVKGANAENSYQIEPVGGVKSQDMVNKNVLYLGSVNQYGLRGQLNDAVMNKDISEGLKVALRSALKSQEMDTRFNQLDSVGYHAIQNFEKEAYKDPKKALEEYSKVQGKKMVYDIAAEKFVREDKPNTLDETKKAKLDKRVPIVKAACTALNFKTAKYGIGITPGNMKKDSIAVDINLKTDLIGLTDDPLRIVTVHIEDTKGPIDIVKQMGNIAKKGAMFHDDVKFELHGREILDRIKKSVFDIKNDDDLVEKLDRMNKAYVKAEHNIKELREQHKENVSVKAKTNVNLKQKEDKSQVKSKDKCGRE